MTEPLGQSVATESLAERTMREVYGYTRRPGQSAEFVTVPLALLQEAEMGCPEGDSKELLRAMLIHGRPETDLGLSGARLLDRIDEAVRFIVDLDMPEVPDEDRERLIGHLTGALFVSLEPEPPSRGHSV